MENFFGSIAVYFKNNPVQLVCGIFLLIIIILTLVLPGHIMLRFTKPGKVTSSRIASGVALVLGIAFVAAVGLGYIK